MPKPPDRDHRITLDQAKQLVKAHKEKGETKRMRGGVFGREAIEALISQPGCAGLRFYIGREADGSEGLVLVGMDEDGKDMTQGLLLNNHWPCPPVCPPESDLNT